MLFRFDHYALDTDRRELCRESEPVAVEPQVFDLLVYLLQNRDRVVSKDDLIAAVWGGRIVSESTLTSRINAARKALGDSGGEQRLIRTIARKGFRFVAEVDEAVGRLGETARLTSAETGRRQDIRFCTAADGVRIAFACVGAGPPLVKTANWLNHLEYDWRSPVWRHLLQRLAAEHRLVRYDQRGNGLSDWDAPDMSFEARVGDLESVVETVGLDRFSLLGMSGGSAVAIAYAVRFPDKVNCLVLYGGFARGAFQRGSQQEREQYEAMATLMRHGWGQDNPAFRQLFTSQFIPGGTPEQVQWFNNLQRIATSPENAERIMRAIHNTEVTDLLARVRTPTLVLHCRDDARVPFEEGRRMAAGIPGARFVAIEGRNHIILEGEPAFDQLVDEIRTFMAPFDSAAV
jgi:DNA-binding winged helix-turn-helix (wHTH) protein/alpha-beta hydrolase superfamily lysophospholipase